MGIKGGLDGCWALTEARDFRGEARRAPVRGYLEVGVVEGGGGGDHPVCGGCGMHRRFWEGAGGALEGAILPC